MTCGPYAEHLAGDLREQAQVMHDLSEGCWHAGWLWDLEYWLWDFMHNGVTDEQWPLVWGHCDLHEVVRQLERLRELSATTGAWIVYPDGGLDVTPVPLDEWRGMYNRHVRA